MKKLLFSLICLLPASWASAEISLDRCQQLAKENYPLIRQYDLLSATEEIELSDINKGWLPKVGVYLQGTIQNVVPSFPSTLTNVMQQMGGDIKGLGKFQYKLGADVNQTIWDGGASKAQREIARRSTEVNKAALDVEIYGIRQRVQSLYFGILLLESQIEQSESAVKVYDANLSRLQAMVKNGTAMQSDADMVEAQLLGIKQQIKQAKSALKGYRDMLSIFTGQDISKENLILPEAELPTGTTTDRPEMTLFDAKEALTNARREMTQVSLMPKIGLFAQAYYGYPGIDYFKAMMGRDLTFNVVAGVKASWNLDALYTKKNSLHRLDLANRQTETDRETFLFNNSMQASSQNEEIKGLRDLMADDSKIVELRRNVRNAAESQLKNGVIDATALTTKINDETQAKLTAAYHSIQYVQAIYNLKNTLNR